MLVTILTNILLLGYLATEIFSRKKGEAKSLSQGESDKRSTNLIGIAFGIAIVLLLTLTFTRIGFFRLPILDYIGIALMALGVSIRFWSMAVLGKFYTRTLKITEEQRVVQNGPYKVIRHPGYLSSILIWLGTGGSIENWILISLYLLIFGTVYRYRIKVEEEMLLQEFGRGYEDYRKKSWRLLPGVY